MNVRDDVGEVDTRWLSDNIWRQVGDGECTLFRVDPWLEGKPLCEMFVRLFELTENKLDTMDAMFARGWGVSWRLFRGRRSC